MGSSGGGGFGGVGVGDVGVIGMWINLIMERSSNCDFVLNFCFQFLDFWHT